MGEPPSVLWLDAHGDYNTPETTTGGFLDGMALAMLTGRCWRAMTAQVPGFEPVAEKRVVMFGTRDLDSAGGELLRSSRIRIQRSVAGRCETLIADNVAASVHREDVSARGPRRRSTHRKGAPTVTRWSGGLPARSCSN